MEHRRTHDTNLPNARVLPLEADTRTLCALAIAARTSRKITAVEALTRN